MLPAAPLPAHLVTEIRFRYLTDEHMTIAQLAELYQHPAHRIASLLKGKDYDTFKQTVQQTLKQAAVDKLVAGAESAAEHWRKAIPIAAARGDHRPMKDLLIATKAIDATAVTAPAVVVQIGISASDVTIGTTVAVHSADTPASLPILSGHVIPPADGTGT